MGFWGLGLKWGSRLGSFFLAGFILSCMSLQASDGGESLWVYFIFSKNEEQSCRLERFKAQGQWRVVSEKMAAADNLRLGGTVFEVNEDDADELMDLAKIYRPEGGLVLSIRVDAADPSDSIVSSWRSVRAGAAHYSCNLIASKPGYPVVFFSRPFGQYLRFSRLIDNGTQIKLRRVHFAEAEDKPDSYVDGD